MADDQSPDQALPLDYGSFPLEPDPALVRALLEASPACGALFPDLDPGSFTRARSYSRMYPTTAGPRHGGIGGRMFTLHRVLALASDELVLAFANERFLGHCVYTDEAWHDIVGGGLDAHITQVNPVTGEPTWVPGTGLVIRQPPPTLPR